MSSTHLLSPKGFKAAGVRAGIKASGKRDVGLLVCDAPATAAALFTSNRVFAAPVAVGREHVGSGKLRGVVMNSGNANACTGKKGMQDARQMCVIAADCVGGRAEDYLPSSTGIIGHLLPMEKVIDGISNAAKEMGNSREHAEHFMEAILTTDLVRKEAAATVKIGKQTITLAGVCKGSGMIGPRLGVEPGVPLKGLHATMLAYVTTDAAISAAALRKILLPAAGRSFNSVTVDDHTSTNDTLAILASGAGGSVKSTGELAKFSDALDEVCVSLSKQIAADGEGATKMVTVIVRGAKTDRDANRMARAIANSPLLKCALNGNDPNWGRIVSAAGLSGAAFDPDKAELKLQGTSVFRKGTPLPFVAPVPSIAAPELAEQVTPLASPEGVSAFAASPAGDRFAFVVTKLRKKSVVLDDKPGQAFDEVRQTGDKGAVLFSADGKHIAYVARAGKSWSIVLDNAAGPELERIDSDPRFKPDGSAVACIGTRNSNLVLVVINVGGGEPVVRDLPGLNDSGADAVALSGDFKHVAYVEAPAADSQDMTVIIDGKPSEKFASAEKPVFSPDGKHYGFLAKTAAKADGNVDEWIVVDGNRLGPFHDLSSFTFSPDSQHCAAIRGATGGGGPVMPAMPGSPAPDKAGVVLDGKLMPMSYDAINAPILFSPDGKQIAFAVDSGAGRAWIVDGKAQPPFQNVHALSFSSDSKHFAYGAEAAAGVIVVVDGKPGPTVRDVANDFALVFSPDSNHIAYVGVDGDGVKAPMLDGVAVGLPSPSWSPRLMFSPDSKHLVAQGAKRLSIDGVDIREPFLASWPVVFDGGDRCHLLITQADKGRGRGAARSFARLDITIH